MYGQPLFKTREVEEFSCVAIIIIIGSLCGVFVLVVTPIQIPNTLRTIAASKRNCKVKTRTAELITNSTNN